MAHYCVNLEKSKNCKYLFRGVAIFRGDLDKEKKLCNIINKENKPCFSEDEDIDYYKTDLFKDVCPQDFIDFFGKTREEVLIPLVNSGHENLLKAELFKDARYQGAKDIVDIYKDTDYFTIHLNIIGYNYFNEIKKLQLDSNYIFELCNKKFPNPNGVKVLDYGCGSGKYGIKLALMGYDVTLADIPHKTFQFLKFICKKYNIKINFLELSENNYALTGKYDYIICTDVLEHVDEPEEVLRVLIEHMDDKGWMFLATFFDDMNGQDMSHLHKNTMRYNNFQNWLGRVVEMGLIPLAKDKNGVIKGYRKAISLQ